MQLMKLGPIKNGRVWVLAGALAATAAVGYAQMNDFSRASLPNTKEAQTFYQVYNAIEQLYLTKPDSDKLLMGAVQGMVGSLNDPFTYYEPPADNVSSQQELAGEFYGIGVQLTAANSDGTGGRVDTVFKVGAAAQAGVQAGDIFVKIGNTDVTNAKLADIVKLVRGEKGTRVTITFKRGSSTYTVTMERQPVTIVSVEEAMLPGNIGYIALNTFFNEKVNDQFKAAIADMKKRGVNKLILDLRDNGGGLLNSGIFVADQFLSKGTIVSLRNRDGKIIDKAEATASPSDYTGKLVVLVNKNSASASEIVAGALQDNKRATILGEQSFGKGVGQQVIDTADGGRVAIVNFTWITPGGHEIQKKGITPDTVVADNRFPTPLNFTGSGAPANSKITIEVAGKPVEVTTDKDGKFTYTAQVVRPARSSTQGEATVSVKDDAELARAVSLLQ